MPLQGGLKASTKMVSGQRSAAMKQKLYIESTIPSSLTSRPSKNLIVAAHQEITHEWWENRKNDFAIYISQFVLDEVGSGDPEASRKRLDAIEEFEQLDITDDVTNLAAALITSGAIPQNSPTDAAHIAIAAVHSMQFLMTWNCAHIANAEISSVVKKICKDYGFECPIICTPEELMGG